MLLAPRTTALLASRSASLARASRRAPTLALASSSQQVAAMASTPKLKLVYFNIKARAEPTRLALHIAGIPFEDVRIEHDAWPAMKAAMPFGQIPVRRRSLGALCVSVQCCALPAQICAPRCAGRAGLRTKPGTLTERGTRASLCTVQQVLEVDGEPLGQSYAQLMYAGRLAKLIPEDALGSAKARVEPLGLPVSSAPPTLMRAL
jgi:hypothetical protein